MTDAPVDPGYITTAQSRGGHEIGWGAGDTVTVALQRLRLAIPADHAPPTAR